MTQAPLPRSSPKPPDFKARFGVVPDGPQPKMTRLQARRAKKKRFRTGAVVFGLLLGLAGGTAFLIGQDWQSFATLFKSRLMTASAPAPAPAPAPTPPSGSAATSGQAPPAAPAPVKIGDAAPLPDPVDAPVVLTAPVQPAAPAAAEPVVATAPEPGVAVAEAPAASAPPAEPGPSVGLEPPAAVAAAQPPAPASEPEPVPVPGPQPVAVAVPEPVPETISEPAPAAAAEPVAEPAPVATAEPVAEPAPEPVPEAVPAPAPAPLKSGTENFQFPASPVVGPESQTQTKTVTENVPDAVEALAQPAPSVSLDAPDPAQVAVAVPPPAAAAAPGSALVQGQVFRDCENCPDLVVVVPPGGLPAEQVARVARQADAPALTPFAIGRFEITFDDWGRCMAGGGCTALPADEGWGRNARPVIHISHDDATAQYIAWLSRMTGAAYRLPTSAEWDFAEMGGGIAPSSSVPLLDAQTICQSGNYATGTGSGAQDAGCADGFPTTAPAGSMKGNALGLHDMRGNVWEWVSDCWTPGFTYKVKDSERDCRRRLLRGGSWSSRATLAATAARGFEDAKRATKSIGFRIARALP